MRAVIRAAALGRAGCATPRRPPALANGGRKVAVNYCGSLVARCQRKMGGGQLIGSMRSPGVQSVIDRLPGARGKTVKWPLSAVIHRSFTVFLHCRYSVV